MERDTIKAQVPTGTNMMETAWCLFPVEETLMSPTTAPRFYSGLRQTPTRKIIKAQMDIVVATLPLVRFVSCALAMVAYFERESSKFARVRVKESLSVNYPEKKKKNTSLL